MSDNLSIEIAMRVRAIMGEIIELDAITQARAGCELVRRDEEDLMLSYAKLGRLLTRLRFPILQRSA